MQRSFVMKNNSIRYALVLAALLSLTGCRDSQKDNFKKEKSEQASNFLIDEETRKIMQKQKEEWEAQNQWERAADIKWSNIVNLGVSDRNLFNIAEQRGFVETCKNGPNCSEEHDFTPFPHYSIIAKSENNVRELLPNYDLLPAEAKAVVLQTEILVGLKNFPQMTEALKNNDFATAAKECGMKNHPQAQDARKKALEKSANYQEIIKQLIQQKQSTR